MTTVDISGWSKRNVWRLPSGELCVRPGLRLIFDVSGSARLIAPGAFTIRNEFAGGEPWHYFIAYNDLTSVARQPKLFVMDENFVTVQSLAINTNSVPRGLSSAVVQGQIVIGSPDIPTIGGLVGSGVDLAVAVDGEDETVTYLEIPRAIVTSWAGSRVVYASGRSLLFSDPVTAVGGSPFTIEDLNQCELPGVIYGIHEGGGGMLVAVTDAGVYGLDSSAASVGIIGDGGADWRLLNHHRASGYDQSCVVRGRVYALTLRGYMLVDVENDDEVILNEPMMSIGIGAGRYALEDFRSARMIAGEDGPIVGVDDLAAAVMVDVTQDPPLVSWWKASTFDASSPTYGASSIGGVLHDVDGTPLLVGLHGIYAATGDFDGSQLLSSAPSTFHTGSLRGRIPTPAAMNPNPRHIAYAAALGGGTPLVRCAVRGLLETQAPAADTNGLTIGSSSWGDADARFTVTPMASVTFDFDDYPTNDVTLEVGADVGLTRLDTVLDVKFAESAKTRPQNKPAG